METSETTTYYTSITEIEDFSFSPVNEVLPNSQEVEPSKRKSKSLLALCKKFLDLYPLEMPRGSSLDIPLEQLSEKLNLSRRRLYDIINIMECLQMAVKVTKNLYRWYGTRNVQKLLSQLKEMNDQDMNNELNKLTDLDAEDPSVSLQPPCTPQGDGCSQSLLLQSLTHEAPPTPKPNVKRRPCNLVDINESPEPKGPNSWKMKSLGGTCLKFLTLFFKHEAVSLEWAGRVLLCGKDEDKASSQDSSQSSQSSSQSSVATDDESQDVKAQERLLRNKVRRIYDVANVLCALGLVCKVNPRKHNSRRLLYAYSGPAILEVSSANDNPVSEDHSMEPPKPIRMRVKKVGEIDNAEREPQATGGGLCKRKLDLGNNTDCSERKKTLVDEVMSELDDGSSAFSVLLAVAERELKEFASPTPQLMPTEVTPTKEPQANSPSPLSDKTDSHSNEQHLPNQEKKLKSCPVVRKISPKDLDKFAKPFVDGRSALRSLLENNPSGSKSDFPAIKKFVVCNENSVQQNRSVLVSPFSGPGPSNPPRFYIRSPIQTVVIKNVASLVRRNGLTIPWRLNHKAACSTPQLGQFHIQSKPANN